MCIKVWSKLCYLADVSDIIVLVVAELDVELLRHLLQARQEVLH